MFAQDLKLNQTDFRMFTRMWLKSSALNPFVSRLISSACACVSARINRTVKSTKNHDFSMTVLYDDGTYYFNIILLLQMCNALIQAFSTSKTAFYVSLHTSTILSNCILCLSAHQHVKMHTTLSCVPGISLKHSNIIYTHDEVSDRKRSGW